MATPPPIRATIFSYQVGFGDCFLLRFDYARAKARHILIDFGSMGLPENAPAVSMAAIAQQIATDCGGSLDALVATHRHADHISGFATSADGKGPGDVIAALKPKVVVQPWTEHPDVATTATSPAIRRFSAALNSMNDVAGHVVKRLDANPGAFGAKGDRLRFLGEDNIKNLSAVKNLQKMAGKKGVYTHHGKSAGLASALPGVTVHVLGPPTVKQHDAVRKQRSRHPDEFWHLQSRAFGMANDVEELGNSLFPSHPSRRGSKLPFRARWLATRLREANAEQTLQIVRMLDDKMNNTSLILLFEAGNKKFLFPGDAQWENWEYALSQPWVVDLLKDVDVYKVGHHGSLNATPRSMWDAFSKKSTGKKKGRLTTVLSTLAGHHGHPEDKTEVPRRTLVSALKKHSDFHSTEDLGNELRKIITIDLQS
jgi:hypothetical protein